MDYHLLIFSFIFSLLIRGSGSKTPSVFTFKAMFNLFAKNYCSIYLSLTRKKTFPLFPGDRSPVRTQRK